MCKKLSLVALLAIVFLFLFSGCGEDSPNIPDVPTPTPEVPTPSFHNIKFSGNGVVFEIISEGNYPNATYPFTIEGSN
ncbi:MAG: hypothetical protein Q3992_04200, partial [Bacteroides sp.]|nr:hypothetical protein [Bacteroides sp.]